NGLGGAPAFGGAPSFGGSPSVGGSGSGGFNATGGNGGGSAGGTSANGGNGGGSFLDASADASRTPGPCGEGSYAGTLDGPYTTGNSTSEFVARVAFTITATGAISGTLTGTSNPTGHATLSGKMNCSTNEASIAIMNGKYTAGMGATFTYTGTMSGVYVPETASFPGGTWTITEPDSSSGGRGSWSAQFQ
ncbi:MAG TPA: hypothetical protein VH142_18685, partial [Polyangiaceae bacterium]|nr:hypothetical protein [Polyangiaceae bacterium]